jgi:hypothetical protein
MDTKLKPLSKNCAAGNIARSFCHGRWNAGGPVEFLTAAAGHLSEMNQPSNAVSRVCLN